MAAANKFGSRADNVTRLTLPDCAARPPSGPAIKTQNLAAGLVTASGLDLDTIMLKIRRLREAGRFSRETRSPNSPHPGARDVACVLVMMLSEAPAAFAGRTIERAETLEIPSGDLKHTRQADPLPGRLAVFQREGHNFVDALEALVLCAIEQPSDFTGGGAPFPCSDIRISFDRQAFTGAIDLIVRPPITGFTGDELRPLIQVLVEYGDFGDRRTAAAPPYFHQINSIDAPFLAAIGQAFAREAT